MRVTLLATLDEIDLGLQVEQAEAERAAATAASRVDRRGVPPR